jgi:hypothetical protein
MRFVKLLKLIFRFSVGPILGVVCILLVFYAWGYCFYGSFYNGLVRLSGSYVIVENDAIDLGTILVGNVKTGKFKLKNIINKSITIIGAEIDCSCISVHCLPLTVPANSTVEFSFDLYVDKRAEEKIVRQQIMLYLDIDQPQIILNVKAQVITKSM